MTKVNDVKTQMDFDYDEREQFVFNSISVGLNHSTTYSVRDFIWDYCYEYSLQENEILSDYLDSLLLDYSAIPNERQRFSEASISRAFYEFVRMARIRKGNY